MYEDDVHSKVGLHSITQPNQGFFSDSEKCIFSKPLKIQLEPATLGLGLYNLISL